MIFLFFTLLFFTLLRTKPRLITNELRRFRSTIIQLLPLVRFTNDSRTIHERFMIVYVLYSIFLLIHSLISESFKPFLPLFVRIEVMQNSTNMTKFLFPKPISSKGFSFFILVLRVFFGAMLIRHGVDKLINYTDLCFVFPDPLKWGHEVSLVFAIFGEFLCSTAFIVGILYRITMIPTIIVMATAFFYIHGGNIANGELSFVYLMILLFMYIVGPGRYSFDAMIYNHFHKKEEEYEY